MIDANEEAEKSYKKSLADRIGKRSKEKQVFHRTLTYQKKKLEDLLRAEAYSKFLAQRPEYVNDETNVRASSSSQKYDRW